jgi:HPt (histidine-containing phosphotransfer) domain-containing protein
MALAAGKIKTQREMSDLMGVSAQTVSKWLKDPTCPIDVRPPWTRKDCEILTAWRNTLQADRANPDDTARMVDVKLKLERMLKLKLERQILERSYISVDEVKHEWASQARRLKHSMTGVAQAVSVLHSGAEAHLIEQEITEEVNNRLMQLSIDNEPMTDAKAA